MSRLRHILLTTLLLFGALSPAATALDNGIARTPPMGWNSWYAYHCHVTEQDVLANARALVASGMAQAGYRYVVVDGCWEAPARDAAGALQADPTTFPDGMAQLGSEIHSLGLEFGIYTSAGRRICNHQRPGSYGHLDQDMQTFASWGVDYVKVDWCNAARGQQLKATYAAAARAAANTGRPMLVTVSTPGLDRPWLWAGRYGNTWRIAPDITASWRSVMSVLDVDAPLHRYAGPGGWNDADILQVGLGHLTAAEARAHFSLWAMLSSPLLAGDDLTRASNATLSILRNSAVIAIDQDSAGHQARRVSASDGHELWLRQLAGRAYAVLLLNRTGPAGRLQLDLAHIPGLPAASAYSVRDLWSGRAQTTAGTLRLSVSRHGVVLLRVTPQHH